MLADKGRQMGKLVAANRSVSQIGAGSGILIAPNLFLTSRHCVELSQPYSVVLGAHESFFAKGEAFQVSRVHLPDSATALKHGLTCGPRGDWVILELAPRKGRVPGDKYGFTPIKNLGDSDPGELLFLGYSSGSHLKVSSQRNRPLELAKYLASKWNTLKGKILHWNKGQTRGRVESTEPTRQGVQVNVQSASRRREFVVQRDGTILRESGAVANSSSPFFVERPNLIGPDHIVVAHKASPGSSGGIYFTQQGDIYATQRGMLKSPGHHPNHIAYFPYKPTVIDFYDDMLVLEGKKNKTVASPQKNVAIINDQIVMQAGEGQLANFAYLFTHQNGHHIVIDPHQAKHTLNWPGGWPHERGTTFPRDMSYLDIIALAKSLSNLIPDLQSCPEANTAPNLISINSAELDKKTVKLCGNPKSIKISACYKASTQTWDMHIYPDYFRL